MKKILVLCALFLPFSVIADENLDAVSASSVSERVNCADVQSEIKKLSELENSTVEESAKLEELKSKYRVNCSKSANRRASVVRSRGFVNNADDVVEPVVSDDTVVDNSIETETQFSEEEIAKFIESGLCMDGTKPNRFGCCTGEKFTDMGDGAFACCKVDTQECFDPMK